MGKTWAVMLEHTESLLGTVCIPQIAKMDTANMQLFKATIDNQDPLGPIYFYYI